MSEGPAYVILGRGRWAQKMRPVISNEHRLVVSVDETRRHLSESESDYVERIVKTMKTSGAQIAWLCIAPGPHVSLMIQAAIEAGLHVIVEKPWYGSTEDTRRLQSLARQKDLVLAIHFEYLFLDEVAKWRADFHPGTGCRFGGRFQLNRPDPSGIPALDNLGSHLFSIREYALPSSEVSAIHCGYNLPDERVVWVERRNQRLASIDLLNHSQRIIQNFMKKVEAALDGAAFPFDLEFALRVAVELNAYMLRGPV